MIIPGAKKKMASAILAFNGKDEAAEPVAEEQDEGAGLSAASAEVIEAIHNNDSDALADALKSFWELCEAQPHTEGPNEAEEE
jgi:hypothetical protein